VNELVRLGARQTPVLEGRAHPGDLDDAADAIVVGSGASGAVAARLLAEAGWSVIVAEEGGYVRPEEYARFRPTETMRAMFRDAGTTTALGLGETPLLTILAGRAVGGSSTLTGGVIFRIPEAIADRWATELGLAELSPGRMEEVYAEVERELRVSAVPDALRSRSTALFAEGARRLGYELKAMRRNVEGCRGASRCNFGCPHLAKRSVDLTYLPAARRHGARVISDLRVTRLVVAGDRIAGVEGRLLDADGRARGRVRLHAPRVLLAGSALSTPLLLARAGVGRASGQVGRNLALHPAMRVAALFDEEVEGWKGALQSAYSDAFEAEGLTVNGAYAPLNVLAAMFPGAGPEFRERTARMRHLATFGVLVHDDAGGRIRRLPGGRPLITYRMSPRDRARMLKGVRLLAETFFAAGAREVYLPVFGLPPLRSADGLKFLEARPPIRRFECMSFHPLGTARMGVEPRRSAVGPTGETWDVRGLYVIDGSVFPTSVGVNTQLPIMAVATQLVRRLAERRRAAA
jgi:choline dehydrogenase-like flavoprotein